MGETRIGTETWSTIMISRIPIAGALIQLVGEMSMALPFWITWDLYSIGQRYIPDLPERYHHPGFWNLVGIFICAGILKAVFVPRLASVHNEATAKDA